MAYVNLTIMVDEDRRSEIKQIETALKKQGLEVRETIPEFRTILGSSDSSLLNQLQSVEGVQMVRPEGRFQHPPMDDKIPQ
jgi:hypothetical protein